jgi:DNA-binding XRE family transcriptional regulator
VFIPRKLRMISFEVLTGAKLRAHRKATGLTQAELAKRAGFSRHAVYYWEGKKVVNTRQAAPRAFCEVLGLTVFSSPNARARGWGLTWPDPWQDRRRIWSSALRCAARAHLPGHGIPHWCLVRP